MLFWIHRDRLKEENAKLRMEMVETISKFKVRPQSRLACTLPAASMYMIMIT